MALTTEEVEKFAEFCRKHLKLKLNIETMSSRTKKVEVELILFKGEEMSPFAFGEKNEEMIASSTDYIEYDMGNERIG